MALMRMIRDFMIAPNGYDSALYLKGQEIEEVILYRLAKLLEKTGKSAEAISYYEALIAQFEEGIYNDEAHYYLAEIYRTLVEKVPAKD